MRVPDDWFVGFHEGLAARFWQAAGEAMLERDFAIVEALLPPGSVLDVPCGDGRLSRRLAEAGHEVIGIDIAPGALALAPPGLRLMQGDLRALPEIGPFDAALSWSNSFGYLTPPDTAQAFAGLRRVVKPGGTLVLESGAVAESLLPRLATGESEYELAGITMRSNPHLPAGREPARGRLRVHLRWHDRARARRVLRPHDRRGRADARHRRVRARGAAR